MLDPNEQYVFDDMVTQLRSGDPKFVRQMDKLCHPRRQPRVALAILLWTLAPISIYYGGWTGLLMAVVGAAYGAHLFFKQQGFSGDANPFAWWSSSRRSPLG
jgi:hypothetical protein